MACTWPGPLLLARCIRSYGGGDMVPVFRYISLFFPLWLVKSIANGPSCHAEFWAMNTSWKLTGEPDISLRQPHRIFGNHHSLNCSVPAVSKLSVKRSSQHFPGPFRLALPGTPYISSTHDFPYTHVSHQLFLSSSLSHSVCLSAHGLEC